MCKCIKSIRHGKSKGEIFIKGASIEPPLEAENFLIHTTSNVILAAVMFTEGGENSATRETFEPSNIRKNDDEAELTTKNTEKLLIILKFLIIFAIQMFRLLSACIHLLRQQKKGL